ncbi:hypothetical protein MBOL_38140 [Mycobacteroides abscessus subsp. bolletii BD]|nr:hypothetical protein MBOL_38140 [Mycobacteroides abscessus subsp. bolletii BD]
MRNDQQGQRHQSVGEPGTALRGAGMPPRVTHRVNHPLIPSG